MIRVLARFTAIVLALALCGHGEAFAQVKYKVRYVKGVVLTRAATSAKWFRVVEGAVLHEDQIIQVTSGATVALEERTKRKAAGFAKDRVQLTISQPIVARLSGDLLRQVRLSAFFVDRPRIPSTDEKPSAIPLTLNDAWDRLAAFVTNIPPPETPPQELADLEQQGIALGISAKRIRIVAPVANTVVQSSEWPTELKVVWAPPTPSLRYFVYVWPAGSARPAPVAETRRDFHTVKVSKPGTYFVQVTSVDGTWQSAAHAVHAIAPMDGVAASVGSKAMPSEIMEGLALQFPLDRFVVAPTSSESLTFTWDLRTTWNNPTYELQIFDAQGNSKHRLSTQSSEAQITLAPGKYTWSVGLDGASIRSEKRHFEILDPAKTRTSDQRRQLVRSLISTGQNATVALDEGI